MHGLLFADRLQAGAGAELLLQFVEFARHRRGGGAGFDRAGTEDQGDAGVRRARHVVQRRQGDRLQGAFHARVLALQVARQLGHPRTQVPSTRLVHHDGILTKLPQASTTDIAAERSRAQMVGGGSKLRNAEALTEAEDWLKNGPPQNDEAARSVDKFRTSVHPMQDELAASGIAR